MTDPYLNTYDNPSDPARNAASITPSDDDDLANVSKSLFVGGAGTLKIDTVGGSTVTFTGVVAGSIIPVRAAKIYATGTTATNIVSMY